MCYLYYHAHAFSIPLQSVTAKIDIVDVLARVRLSQYFVNDQVLPWSVRNSGIEDLDLEAIYKFPVPPGAAVCEFEAVLNDGTTIVGIVKEKEEAKKEYDTAIASGKQAALAVHERTDIFTISVGNIPNKSTVTINLTYVMELTDDGDVDQVRFVLPTTIAEKYGNDSTGRTNVRNSTAANYKLDIIASIQMNQPIRSIASPSHSIETHLGVLEPQQSEDSFDPKHAHVTLAASAWLDRDLVITVKSSGLDAPRCTAETFQPLSHPSAPSVFTIPKTSGKPSPTIALALTLVPRFNLPPIERQEYILVADRSGSMGGFKIKTLQAALHLLLRSLPPAGTFFQIISFGSHHSLLFEPRSEPYNEQSLQRASKLVDSMTADYGGTEIRNALMEGAFRRRRTDIPTSVFVLTDGEVSDMEDVLHAVRTATTVGKGQAPLRVFSLGIGNAVDAALVGGMAREGGGVSQFVGEGERMDSKLIKLLRAARSPAVRDVRVEWTPEPAKNFEDDFELVAEAPAVPAPTTAKMKLSLFDTNYKPEPIPNNTASTQKTPVALPAFDEVQQGPASIACIYSGARVVVYAILASTQIPSNITLRAKTESGDELELIIPVEQYKTTAYAASKLQSISNTATVPLIHTLAARKLLGDIDEHSSWSSPMVRARMVRLGIVYNLASQHTSFVAVEPDTEDKRPDGKHWRRKRHITVSNHSEANSVFDNGKKSWSKLQPFGLTSFAGPGAKIAISAPSASFNSVSLSTGMLVGSSQHAPGCRDVASTPLAMSSRLNGGISRSRAAASTAFDHDRSPIPPPPSGKIAPPAPRRLSVQRQMEFTNSRSDSDQEILETGLRPEKRKKSGLPTTHFDSMQRTDRRAELVRLQAFDGSFASIESVCSVIGIGLPAVPKTLETNPSKETLWATWIALAWIKKVCANEQDEWELMVMKAEGFISGKISDFASVEQAAFSLF